MGAACRGWAALAATVLLLLSGAVTSRELADEEPETIHIIFSAHLDVGFTALDSDVINAWFHEHLPNAARVAKQMRENNSTDRLRFMTNSWIVSLFFNCPTHIGIRCPTNEEAREVTEAIRLGDLYWHGMPHTAQVETFDPPLLEAAIDVAHQLDDFFGLPRKQAMRQTDVPGLTRAAIPILVGQGVRALSVGVNAVTAPPAVPKNELFWWRDEPSGTALLSWWHPGGYSGSPVDLKGECIAAPNGLKHRLCTAWKNDNTGPPALEDVASVFQAVRGEFPGARVIASTLDDFVAPLLAEPDKLAGLPVITGELGDTWLHGVQSDPGKVAEYRELLRFRRAGLQRFGAEALKKFDRLLLMLPEHTCGVDIGKYLNDWGSWGNDMVHEQIKNKAPNYVTAIESWQRQRSYIDWSVQALGKTYAREEAQQILKAHRDSQRPPDPKAAGLTKANLSEPLHFEGGQWSLDLDAKTGAIVGLVRAQKEGSQLALPSLASADSPLALVVYNTYSAANYTNFTTGYNWAGLFWIDIDFGKYALPATFPYREVIPTLKSVWSRKGDNGSLVIVSKAAFPKEEVDQAGAPVAVWTQIESPAGSSELYVTLTWQNKTPTRLPEALWVRWRPDPRAVDPNSWSMYKLGQPISPLDTIINGSRSLHIVGDEGVVVDTTAAAAGRRASLRIRSLDAGMVSPGIHTPFPNLADPLHLEEGMAFCLVNNIWGTNYPQWYPFAKEDADLSFRFVLQIEEGQDGGGAASTARRKAKRRRLA